jgi:hypothetical protein
MEGAQVMFSSGPGAVVYQSLLGGAHGQASNTARRERVAEFMGPTRRFVRDG